MSQTYIREDLVKCWLSVSFLLDLFPNEILIIFYFEISKESSKYRGTEGLMEGQKDI